MHRSIAHYKILERLGAGGMGVVYKARDTDLDRLVALKFLPVGGLGSDEGFEAFLYEARAISQLNHPNITTIYAVEEENGERFLALEYMPGGTLRDRIRDAEGLLSPDQVLGWATPIARALAHAHRHGIIHRDVKSENVLLTAEDGAKLTDFGVALVRGAAETGSATTAGTAAYMSPEQAQGLELDQRSDIFSFGILLYELAAGRPPFTDPQEAVVLYDIVNTPPESLDREDLPPSFRAVLDRLLAKAPDKRYASMDDVVEALNGLGRELGREQTGERDPVEPAAPAIAVLPFVDMSPQADQDYFCDGITEEITLALSRIAGLRVVSRSSAFQFKGQAYDIRNIGRKLKVAAVLEGSVRKAGSTLRISVQLVNVADGYHMWSERYDRRLEDVFTIQEEIAESIVSALRPRLDARFEPTQEPPNRKQPTRKQPTADLDAYNDYLAGRHFLNQRVQSALEQALSRFDRALERDPEFGLAWGAKAETLVLMASAAYVDDARLALEGARRAAEKAIRLEPLRAEPYVALALVRLRADWDWSGAEEAFLRALALNDGYAAAHHQYALYLAFVMRLDEARAEIQRAQELDPLSLLISTAVGRILHFSRRYEEAIEQCRRTTEADPNFVPALFDRLVSLGMLRRFDETLELIEQINRLAVDPMRHALLMGRYYGIVGDRDRAVEQRERLVELSKKRSISPVVLALIDVSVGDIGQAMALLHGAADRREGLLVYLQCEPAYDALRSHPDYPALIRKIGFPAIP